MFADLFSLNEGGQAYITVEADDSMGDVALMEAGGSTGGGGSPGGGTGLSVYLSWTFDSGLTNTGSWDLGGIHVQKVDGDVAATNANLSAVMKQLPPLTVLGHACAKFV